MKKDKIGVAVLACGGRSYYVTNNLLRDSEGGVELLSVYDPDTERMDKAADFWGVANTIKKCSSEEEAINTPGVEWVLIFSPNACHKRQILSSFAAGKNVFSEKPLATTIEDCKEIFDAHQKTDLIFATGFVLRYSLVY